jgi:hypothetical protein
VKGSLRQHLPEQFRPKRESGDDRGVRWRPSRGRHRVCRRGRSDCIILVVSSGKFDLTPAEDQEDIRGANRRERLGYASSASGRGPP